MAVLTAVRVSISDHVVVVVIDGEMAINLVVLVDSIVDGVLVRTEDRRVVFIAVFNDVLVYVFKILTNEEPNSSVANADDLQSVAADNAFQDWYTEYEYYTLGVEPLIQYRGSSLNAVGNNAVSRERGYTQRRMAETSYSSVKRSLGVPCERRAGIGSSVKSS